MANGTRMQQRRDTAANWDTSNYVLAAGEIGFATDTNVIKMGDGVNGWLDLDVLFTGLYLPVEGIAANSELLEGISSDGFVKQLDAAVNATADTVPRRTSAGRLKAANAVDSDDLVAYDQAGVMISDGGMVAKRLTSSRTVTTHFTLTSTDIGKRVVANHSSTASLIVATLPANGDEAWPTGSWVDIVAPGNGGVKISPTGAEVIRGYPYVMPNYDIVRVIRTSTLEWLVMNLGRENAKNRPRMRVYANATVNYVTGQHHGVVYHATDAAETYNPSNEWFEIPGTGLATARRLIVKQDGEYELKMNWFGSLATNQISRICKFSADNTPSTVFCSTGAGTVASLTVRTRLSALESVGCTHQAIGGTDVGQIDDPAAHRNNFTIYRVGN